MKVYKWIVKLNVKTVLNSVFTVLRVTYRRHLSNQQLQPERKKSREERDMKGGDISILLDWGGLVGWVNRQVYDSRSQLVTTASVFLSPKEGGGSQPTVCASNPY